MLSQHALGSIPIQKLADESDLIIHGKVFGVIYASYVEGYDRTALISIISTFKGEWNEDTIEVPFHNPNIIGSGESYDVNSVVVSFLKTSPQVSTVQGTHGVVRLNTKVLYDTFPLFINDLLSSDEASRVDILLDHAGISKDFSFLEADLRLLKPQITYDQEVKILETVLHWDSVHSARPTPSGWTKYEDPYVLHDYYAMLTLIEDDNLKSQAIAYLKTELEHETRHYTASVLIRSLCELGYHASDCYAVFAEFVDTPQYFNAQDSISTESQVVIDKYLNLTQTLTIKFNGFYEVVEGANGQLTYSILLDSTYFPYEDMYLLRIMPLINDEGAIQKLEMGESYEVVIQRKQQYSCGCEGEPPIRIRSQRLNTDEGTVFGSDFLDRMISTFEGTDCRVRVVEYYTILEII